MDKFKAKCKVCMKAFDVSNMGESAFKSHEKGKKHIYLMQTQQRNSTGNIRNLFSNCSSTAPRTPTGSSNSTLTVSSSGASTTAGLSGFITRNDTLTAEIWLALKVNSSHHSFADIDFFSRTAGRHVKLSAMVDATKTTARPIGHMAYTQAPAVCEKNIFHLFPFSQPVKNYS